MPEKVDYGPQADQLFELLTGLARLGMRCPSDKELQRHIGVSPQPVWRLLRLKKRIRVWLARQNFRVVEILEGPSAGRITRPGDFWPTRVSDERGQRKASGDEQAQYRKCWERVPKRRRA